jgi:stalled ribosome rescue protein Dom34
MKVEYGELKDRYGEIRLFPESIDDLWHLRHLITPLLIKYDRRRQKSDRSGSASG